MDMDSPQMYFVYLPTWKYLHSAVDLIHEYEGDIIW